MLPKIVKKVMIHITKTLTKWSREGVKKSEKNSDAIYGLQLTGQNHQMPIICFGWEKKDYFHYGKT